MSDTETTEKKPRVTKPCHPMCGELREVPADYDCSVHARLKECDFADDCVDVYLIMQAEACEAKALALRAQAASAKRLGAISDKKVGKKLLKSIGEIQAHLATLVANGDDVSEFSDVADLLASLGGND